MLETKDISIKLNDKMIIKNISFDTKDKKIIGIIGPNGSGKSTFLKALYRILKVDSGNIILNNETINHYSYKESAKKIAAVAQHNHYNFDFSVIDIVLMARSCYKKSLEFNTKDDYELASQSLKKVGMLNFKDRSFNSLSGGEQQRVILARALTQESDYLILDEPTNHLDIKHQIDIMNLIDSLDCTIISAIHDLNIAYNYCDYIYVIKDGKVYKEGSKEEVLTTNLIKEVFEAEAQFVTNPASNKKQIIFNM